MPLTLQPYSRNDVLALCRRIGATLTDDGLVTFEDRSWMAVGGNYDAAYRKILARVRGGVEPADLLGGR